MSSLAMHQTLVKTGSGTWLSLAEGEGQHGLYMWEKEEEQKQTALPV